MRFRTGLVVGIGVGYVLGARAGRDRYEQIKVLVTDLRRHPAVAQLSEQAVAVVDLARSTVAGGLRAGSEGLRSVAETDRPA
jgi:hypothetical protein